MDVEWISTPVYVLWQQKNLLVSELYHFFAYFTVYLCILQHPDNFSKARPFRIDLEYETTYIQKFSYHIILIPWTIPNHRERDLDSRQMRLRF